jgi:putative peptidoglycan lipid II flippase
MRVVSGIQPTGDLHLGNLLGAILRWVKMQDEAECLFFLADLHALTVEFDPNELRSNVREMAAALIASGIDPAKSIVFAHSAVPAHAELAMLLCLPAALALCASALPLVSAIFEGGRFNAGDAQKTALTLSLIALGLPAYVLVKVLTPGFYARRDTATPVKVAVAVLVANVILNFALIPPFGIGGLAAAVALSSWLNCAILYVLLHRRGHFRVEGWLASRLARQLVAAAVMVVMLIGIRTALAGWFSGSLGHRLAGVIAIVGGGMIVYFPLVWILGGTDKEELRALIRRRKPSDDAG